VKETAKETKIADLSLKVRINGDKFNKAILKEMKLNGDKLPITISKA
jgi:hypothetical protein